MDSFLDYVNEAWSPDEAENEFVWHRMLNNDTFDDDATRENCETLAGSNDARVLGTTFQIYGSLFLVLLLLFSFLRTRFPRVYNLRSWVEEIQTSLAEEQFGFFSWMWKLFWISDAEMLDECGMDALCYTRVLEFGLRLSIVGMLNAIWLIPVYATAKPSPLTNCIDDPIVRISVSHIPSGSLRFCATVIGAYVVFGFTMYSILQEFDWFIRYRHRFLSKTLARNYAVYVQCIPEEYRSNAKLLEFFQQASTEGVVLDAHMAVKIPNLSKKVAERDAVISKLEHAINMEEIRGVTPMQRTAGIIGQNQSQIDVGFRDLHRLNQSISKTIDQIERQANQENVAVVNGNSEGIMDNTMSEYPSTVSARVDYGGLDDQSKISAVTLDKPIPENSAVSEEVANEWVTDATGMEQSSSTKSNASVTTALLKSANDGVKKSFKTAANAAGTSFKTAANAAGTSLKTAANAAGTVANAAANLLKMEDGVPHSAGFVTFKTLRSTQAALQMIQYAEPFAMEVLEAPQPEDVYWKNVGKTHKELQLGKLISIALTVALCLFWTIPMGFISTLSSIEGLRGEFKFIDRLLTDYPGLELFFSQLAPLLIVVANEVLKMILEMLSGLEGPISGAVVQAKLFSKLSTFMIIQTFFVTAIGGSLMSELSAMLQEPEKIVDLLANTLPTQSTFYIQILLVDTFLNMGLELIRISPIVIAAIRGQVGPRLTEKERSTTWWGLRPLCDPSEFEHANLLAGTVLYFMVYFVYATIAPVTTFFMFLCFLLMAAGYRHQFVYIYPTFPDSGGKLLAAFLRLLPACMIIAQVTIVGMLALNTAAVASAMMFPLLIITILFTIYIQQKHFAMTEHLPSKDAIAMDIKNRESGEMHFDFVKDKYIQPELRQREVLPENATVEREMEQGCVHFSTPPASVTGDDAL